MRLSILFVLCALLGCGYTPPVAGQPRVRDKEEAAKQTDEQRAARATKVLEKILVQAPTEEDLKSFRDAQASQAAAIVKELEANIAQQEARVATAKGKNQRKVFEERLADLKASLPAAKEAANQKKLPRLIPEDLKQGDIGQLGTEGSFVEVVQIINSRNMLVKAGTRRIWIENISTNGLADQQALVLTNVFKVAGTKVYRTADNDMQTVFRLLPMNLEAILAGETQEQLDWRIWKTAEFEISSPAQILTVQGNNVVLETKNGTKFTVSRKSFEADDQLRIDQFIARRMLPAVKEPAEVVVIVDNSDARLDPRLRWLNTSYDTTIYFVKDKQWAEVDNKTQKLKWYLVEKDRNVEYIELYNAERSQTTRLRPTKMDFIQGGQWRWISDGRWTTK